MQYKFIFFAYICKQSDTQNSLVISKSESSISPSQCCKQVIALILVNHLVSYNNFRFDKFFFEDSSVYGWKQKSQCYLLETKIFIDYKKKKTLKILQLSIIYFTVQCMYHFYRQNSR